YKEIEMLYEIISPDAFLRPFIDPYGTLSAIYAIVRKAYTRQVRFDRDFQKKTNALVQKHIGADFSKPVEEIFEINEETVEFIVRKNAGAATRVINLVRSIEKTAEDESDDPFLIAMAERSRQILERFEQRQESTEAALQLLREEVRANDQRKKAQAEKNFDGLTYFVYSMLLEAEIPEAEEVSRAIKAAFVEFANWQNSERPLRELRNKVTIAIMAREEEVRKVTSLVDRLFTLLQKAKKL
nr:type I restriction endonuclease subunit R [Calditrichia bacterium]